MTTYKHVGLKEAIGNKIAENRWRRARGERVTINAKTIENNILRRAMNGAR